MDKATHMQNENKESLEILHKMKEIEESYLIQNKSSFHADLVQILTKFPGKRKGKLMYFHPLQSCKYYCRSCMHKDKQMVALILQSGAI